MESEVRPSSRSRWRSAQALAVVLGLVLVAALMPWRASTSSVVQGAGQWVALAQTPFLPQSDSNAFQSGRISSVAVDPRNQSHWLLGVGNGGVWETRDSGGTWVPITDDAPTLAIGAVAFAPSDPNIVYVATGESAGGTGFLHVGVGLLKSTNGGSTWALSGESSLARSSVRRLRVDPNDANILLAASSRGGSGRPEQGPGARHVGWGPRRPVS